MNRGTDDARARLPHTTEHVRDRRRVHRARALPPLPPPHREGGVRIEIHAFVRPGRRTLMFRCAACIDARFAAAVLAVHGHADRVPVDAGLVGSAEALRVQRAIDAACGGGGGGV